MMWNKNFQIYRLLDTEHLPLEQLSEALEKYRFQPCSESQARRVGWSAPSGDSRNGCLVHEVSGHRLITLMRQERILPAPVIRDELAERVDKLTAQQGYPPARRDKLAMKERVVEELLPKAFTKNSRTDVWIDTKANIIGVAAASSKRAEEALDVLRESLGSLKVIPLAPQTPAGRTMTTWLNDPTTRPNGLIVGDRVVLRAKGDDGKIVATSIDVDGDEVRTSLEVGRQVSQMALTFEEQMSFTLVEDMSIKGIRFADAVLKEVDDTDSDENPVMQMETEFVLAAQCLAHTIDKLMHALGGEAKAMPVDLAGDAA
ncbi:recombination-associated protein RdgC [Kushneria sp. Sum13]|uniref:recombination-associated protein RdgC n=1 Tax=Kushneria sp. Sum13 TaxID=3459196 RepID=UPI00404591E6